MSREGWVRRCWRVKVLATLLLSTVACSNATAVAGGALATSIVAVVVSGAQAIFAYRQARIQDDQRYAAVWPRLTFDVSTNVLDSLPGFGWPDAGDSGDDGGTKEARVSFGVINKGVGPALVRAFRVTLDGRPVPSVDALIRTVYEGPHSHSISSIVGEVLAPNEKVVVVSVEGSRQDITPLQNALIGNGLDGKPRLTGRVCYCSVFEQCWWAVTDEEPVATSSCPHDEHRGLHTW